VRGSSVSKQRLLKQKPASAYHNFRHHRIMTPEAQLEVVKRGRWYGVGKRETKIANYGGLQEQRDIGSLTEERNSAEGQESGLRIRRAGGIKKKGVRGEGEEGGSKYGNYEVC